MSYYRVCANCGAHLDPGEKCDCDNKEAAASADTTDNGTVEKELHTYFHLQYITQYGGKQYEKRVH